MEVLPDDPPERSAEEARLLHWQVKQMTDFCGMNHELALLLAEAGVSWHELEALVVTGCPAAVAARILL